MPTTFYLLNEDAPYTPGAWRGSWDVNGSATKAMDPHKFGSTATSAAQSETSATTPYRVAVARFVSRRLAAQTISGTVDMVVGVAEANADADYFTRLHIFVEKTDGTVLGTALNGYEETSGGGATEWTTTSTGRALQSAQTLTNVVVPNDANDYRLVVEIGVLAENSHTTARNATIRLGARGSNETALGDLTAGSTSTTTLAGFLSFSGTISLHADCLSNLTPETATTVSAPGTASQNTRQGGYTYKVWHTYTATADDVHGWFGFGDLVTYRPTVTVFKGPLNSFTNIATAQNRPVQYPTVAGTAYYIRSNPNASTADPATLAIDIDAAPVLATPQGSIFINDDTAGYPAAVLSPTTGDVLRFVQPFPNGEAGDTLATGAILFEDANTNELKLYDASFELQSTLSFTGGDPRIRTNRELATFYVGRSSNPVIVRTVDAAGAFGATTYTLTGHTSLHGFAVSNDGITAYHAPNSSGAALKTWNLNTSANGSDIHAGTAGYFWPDVLVLGNDMIVGLHVNSATGDTNVYRWNSGGALQNTYAFGTTVLPGGTFPRLSYAVDDPISFWIWTHHAGGVSRFRNIRASDGAAITTIEADEFELGAYQGAESATPPRFGVSYSCPLMVLQSTTYPFDLSIPCCPCDCPPELVNGTPKPTSHTGPILAAVDPTSWTPECTGGGDVPSAADATDPESWVQ